MNHVMIDLETLGTSQDAAFISIGACMFDPNTGYIGNTFHTHIDWDDALRSRSATGDTIAWWMVQSGETQAAILAGRVGASTLVKALADLKNWMIGVEPVVWGNGATFDIAILENAYTAEGMVIPWKFWNVRDVRTVVDIAAGIVNRSDIPFEGILHNALDDAIHQAKYVSAMWQALRNGR